jgi:hypothetical protein
MAIFMVLVKENVWDGTKKCVEELFGVGGEYTHTKATDEMQRERER